MARLFFLIALVPPALARAAPQLADEVVAVVDNRPILLSQLEVEARLMRALDEGGPTLQMPMSNAELKAALDRLIDRLVVYEQAERLQVFALSMSEVAAAVSDLGDRLGPKELAEFLADFDVDPSMLAGIVRRNLRVERYLAGRFRLASRPTDVEVRAFYLLHRADFDGSTFDQAAGDIRARLWKEKFRRLARAFVRDVRARARVRILRDLDQPGLDTPLSGTVSASESGASKNGSR